MKQYYLSYRPRTECSIWYKNLTFTIFAPYLLLLFSFTTTYLQRENLCKSILGLWYFQGYIFQPGIYGIIKGLFFNVTFTPNRYILHVLEGYRVISILMWLFRGLHKVTILHVLKERKNCTESAFKISSISCIVKKNARKWCLAPFWWSFISVSDFSLRPSWIFPKRSANDFGWNLLHVRLI